MIFPYDTIEELHQCISQQPQHKSVTLDMPLASYFPKVKGRRGECKQAPNLSWRKQRQLLPVSEIWVRQAIPQLKKKISRAAGCSWTTTHTSGSDNLSDYFLRSDWKQNKRTDSLRVGSFPALVSLPCVLWRVLHSGDCPSYASAGDGKATLGLPAVTFSRGQMPPHKLELFTQGGAGLQLLSPVTSLSNLLGAENLTRLGLNSWENHTKQPERVLSPGWGAGWIRSRFLLTAQATVIFSFYGTSWFPPSLPGSEENSI